MKFEGHGYTGRLFEGESFPRLSKDWEKEGKFDEKKSFDWVKSHQPWNPADPNVVEGGPNHIANDLHYKVAEALELDNVNDLKLYTALDSPLDRFYGIDAFFEYKGAIFTLDLTTNPHKESYKADLIVRLDDFDSEESIGKMAEQIAHFLKKRTEQSKGLAA